VRGGDRREDTEGEKGKHSREKRGSHDARYVNTNKIDRLNACFECVGNTSPSRNLGSGAPLTFMRFKRVTMVLRGCLGVVNEF
jgi:hypothetical protein